MEEMFNIVNALWGVASILAASASGLASEAPSQVCGRSDWVDGENATGARSALLTRAFDGRAELWVCSDLMVCHKATQLLDRGQIAFGWRDDGALVVATDGEVQHLAPPERTRRPWPEIIRRDHGVANVGTGGLQGDVSGLRGVVDLSLATCSLLPDFRDR